MKLGKRILTVISLCIFCVGCDQSTKSLAVKYLSENKIYTYFNDLLRIGYTENTGAFLGIGSELPGEYRFWLFVVLVGLFLTGFFIFLILDTKQSFVSLAALSLILAGGISNFYDRLVNNGAVVDFINMGIGPIRTGIFNVADVFIFAGAAIIIYSMFKRDITKVDLVE